MAAASIACCLDCPSLVAAVAANLLIASADSPKITPTLDWVSARLEAAFTASTPILIAIAPAAAAAAARATPMAFPALPRRSPKESTSPVADLSFLFRSSTSASIESLRVLLPAISHTP